MLSVYQVISGNLNKAVNEHGEGVLKQPLIKTMRVVKKEILTLLSTWIARAFEGSNGVEGGRDVNNFFLKFVLFINFLFFCYLIFKKNF